MKGEIGVHLFAAQNIRISLHLCGASRQTPIHPFSRAPLHLEEFRRTDLPRFWCDGRTGIKAFSSSSLYTRKKMRLRNVTLACQQLCHAISRSFSGLCINQRLLPCFCCSLGFLRRPISWRAFYSPKSPSETKRNGLEMHLNDLEYSKAFQCAAFVLIACSYNL